MRVFAVVLASALAFGSPANAQSASAPDSALHLDPNLLNKLLQLAAIEGTNQDLAASIATPLGFTAGQDWPYREFSRKDPSGPSGVWHIFAVGGGEDSDLFFGILNGNTFSDFRVHRDGEAAAAIVYDVSSGQITTRASARAQADLDREFGFWAVNANDVAEWEGCAAELVGANAVSAQDKIQDCTLLIESGKEMPANMALALVERSTAYDQANSSKAFADLNQAVAVDPTSLQAWAELCSMDNWVSHDTQKATQECTKAIALAPQDPHGWTYRGDIYLQLGQYSQAIEDYNHALELSPTWMWPLDNRGEAYLRSNQIDRAIQDFNAVIQVSPDTSMGFLDRGIAEIRENNLGEAMSDFQAGIKVDPKCSACIVGRGLVERMQGDTADGDADIAKGKAMTPNVADNFVKDGIPVP